MKNIGELTTESKGRLMINKINHSSYKEPRLMINHRVQRVRETAERLVKVFNSPQSKLYFMKVAWHLSEAQIWDMVEISLKKQVPISYFIAATKQLLADQS